MRTRFFYNLTLALAAGFLVVATQAFAAGTVTWLAFGIAIGITTAGLVTLPLRVGLAQRILSAVTVGVGIWTIVASLVFVPTTVVWLGFASAIAFVVLACGGLMAHELTTERVVHALEISHERASTGTHGGEMHRRQREPVAA
jgi:uncharacterized membrane protein